jgi:hypothetical protein
MKTKLLLLIGVVIMLSSCHKNSWGDSGGYYSLHGGFYLDGEEYHFPRGFLSGYYRKVFVNLIVYDSIIDVRFRSKGWVVTPDERDDSYWRGINFDVVVDSLIYDGESTIIVNFVKGGKKNEGLIRCVAQYGIYLANST